MFLQRCFLMACILSALFPAAVFGQEVNLRRIINQTSVLEVVQLKKSQDQYQLSLKNISGNNIIALALSYGGSRLELRGGLSAAPLIAAGAVFTQAHLSGSEIETDGIVIRAVVFEDGSFDGDPLFAAEFLSTREGLRIQLPQVLRLIEQSLESQDAGLASEFERLEARLRAIPEAINKQAALELLRLKFPTLEERALSGLYEKLKGGLYEARNLALSTIGDIKRQRREASAQENAEQKPEAVMIRERLTHLKEALERVIDGLQ